MTDRDLIHQRIDKAIEAAALTIEAQFVPFSASRSAKSNPKVADLNINWKIRLLHKGNEILTSDYSQGIGHIPGYKPKWNTGLSCYEAEQIRRVCEEGQARGGMGRPKVNPRDFIFSLLSDAQAIDYPTYEEYARDLGENPDSRRGEAMYRACIEIALKLRRHLGEDGIKQLREAFQDY